MIFDPINKRIILDTASVTASEIWSRWIDWAITDDNVKYLPALSQVGGDDLGGGLSVPVYIFLRNGCLRTVPGSPTADSTNMVEIREAFGQRRASLPPPLRWRQMLGNWLNIYRDAVRFGYNFGVFTEAW